MLLLKLHQRVAAGVCPILLRGCSFLDSVIYQGWSFAVRSERRLPPPLPRSSLKQWIEVLEERDAVESHYQGTIFDMKSTLEERIKRADDISKAYKHFRLEVAKSSEHSKTGRSISDKLLAQLEAEGEGMVRRWLGCWGLILGFPGSASVWRGLLCRLNLAVWGRDGRQKAAGTAGG